MSHFARKDPSTNSNLLSKKQSISLPYFAAPDQKYIYYTGEVTIQLMAFYYAFLLIIFATAASTEQATAAPLQQVSRPEPFCLEESFYPSVSSSECSHLVNVLSFNAFALETVTWGGFFMPGRLPQVIAKTQHCAIKLRRSRNYAHPERFRLLDYRGLLLEVVSECTGSFSSKGKGGFVAVGTTGMINAWIFGITTDNSAPGLGNESFSGETF
ncbi:MAG: hypothetical protein LQ342_003992 [Letrouitia transgressa]|nr:MAG: hypothetical protein LQ342_003992 [Letrouitia transgressa]